MRIWEKFKYAIFDVDGTIFDNMDFSADIFLLILKNFNLPKEEVKKIYLDTNGMNLNDQFKMIFNKYKINYSDSLITDLNKKFFEMRDNSKK